MTKNYRPKLLALCLLSGISLAATAQETTPFKLKKVTSVEDRCIYAFEQLGRVMTTYSDKKVLDTGNGIPSTSIYAKKNLTGNEEYLWRLVETSSNRFKIANSQVQKTEYLVYSSGLSMNSPGKYTWEFVPLNNGNDEFRITSIGNGEEHVRTLAYYDPPSEKYFYKSYTQYDIDKFFPDYKITLYQLFEEVKVKPAGLATYVSDKILDYTNVDGLKAYKAKVSGNHITFDKVGIVPAAQGVLLRATSTLSEETTFDIPVLYELYTGDWIDDNDFIRGSGAAVPSQSDGYYNYILNSVNGNVGFYHANGQTVATNRAYLRTTSVSSRMSMDFDDDPETTNGIHEMTDDGIRLERDIYDLQGRHVTTPRKGLYIINGKKMVIK